MLVETATVDGKDGLWISIHDSGFSRKCTYSTVDVVCLRFLSWLARLLTVDHAAVHWNRFSKNGFQQRGMIGLSHGIDSSLR
jgi:hypothetical protein